MIAGSTVMFTSCDSKTETTEEATVVEDVETSNGQVQEIETEQVEVENAADTTAVQDTTVHQ